jgi:hypothetical protein
VYFSAFTISSVIFSLFLIAQSAISELFRDTRIDSCSLNCLFNSDDSYLEFFINFNCGLKIVISSQRRNILLFILKDLIRILWITTLLYWMFFYIFRSGMMFSQFSFLLIRYSAEKVGIVVIIKDWFDWDFMIEATTGQSWLFFLRAWLILSLVTIELNSSIYSSVVWVMSLFSLYADAAAGGLIWLWIFLSSFYKSVFLLVMTTWGTSGFLLVFWAISVYSMTGVRESVFQRASRVRIWSNLTIFDFSMLLI